MRSTRKTFPILPILMGLLLVLLTNACQDYRHPNLEPRPIGWQPDYDLNPYYDAEAKMASLEQIKGTKRQLDSLLEWADRVNYYDKEATLAYANEAYNLAAEKGFRLSRAIASYYRGLVKRRESSLDEGLFEALADLKISYELLEKNDPIEWQLQIKGLLAGLYFDKAYEEDNMSFLDSNYYYLEEVNSLLEKAEIPSSRLAYHKAQLLSDKANFFYAKQSILAEITPDSLLNKDSLEIYDQEVIHFFNKAIEEAKVSSNEGLEARMWRGLGDYFRFKDDLGKADSAYIQCEKLAISARDTTYLVGVYQTIADLKGIQFASSYQLSDFEESMSYLRRCLEIQKEKRFFTYNLIAWNYDDYLYISGDPPTTYSVEGDSALYYYNLALEGAKTVGALNSMEGIVKNINTLCGHKLRLTGKDCSELLGGRAYQDLLNESYAELVDSMQAEILSSDKQYRVFEKNQLRAEAKNNMNRTRLRFGVILLLATIVFLLFLLFVQRKRFQARMEALRAQINPHFFHNSLNAIESLVNKNDRAAASKYLVHFSRLSRKVLNSSREPYTTIKEEFQTLKHFLELEKLRFRDKLTYELAFHPDLEPEKVKIPALLLQPYVENAILHGIKPKEEGGHVRVFAAPKGKKLICTIEDNGIGRKKSRELQEQSVFHQQRKSYGMKINEERIRMTSRFSKTQVQIQDLYQENGEPQGTRIEISMPFKLY